MRFAANPIFARELKERMRTLRAPVTLTIYLLVLGLVAFGAEHVLSTDSGFNPLASAGLGRAVFHFLLFFTLMLICFLVPGFTASSVSAERERQTLPILQVTLLRPSAIVLGKLGSSMAFMMLLIVATLPLMSISFILGGVTPLEVLRGYGMVTLTGFTIALVGIGLSARTRRTVSATVLTYALVGMLTIGTVLSYGLVRVIVERRPNASSGGHVWGLVLNPFIGTASAIRGSGASSGPSTPFTSLFDFVAPQRFGFAQVSDLGGPVPPAPVFVGGGGFVGQVPFRGPPVPVGGGVPIWVSTLGWYLGLALVGYLLAVSGVRAPSRGLRLGRRGKASVGET